MLMCVLFANCLSHFIEHLIKMRVHHLRVSRQLTTLLSQVEGSGKYTADHILIAVGGRPTLPNIPGAQHAITSDGFFALTSQPKKVQKFYG